MTVRTSPVRRVQTPRAEPVHRRLDRRHRHAVPGRDRGHRGARGRSASTTRSPRDLPPASDLDDDRAGRGIDHLRPDRRDRAGPVRRRASARSSTYEEIPPILLDATTAIEDKTFWENAGFDPRGHHLGRPRLAPRQQPRRLDDHPAAGPRAAPRPDDLVQDPNRTVERKLKEIIQSIRVTQAFPGEEGKQKIITAYLNQNYYGNQSYGVKAAVESYFGKPLDGASRRPRPRSSPRLPKSPSNYDLVRNAIEQCDDRRAEDDGRARRPDARRPRRHDDRPAPQRRSSTCSPRRPDARCRATQYTAADFEAAKVDEVLLASQATPRWIAPHFVWAVRDELTAQAVRPGCRRRATTLERGGLRVTTTLDLRLQKIAEKWVAGGRDRAASPRTRRRRPRRSGSTSYPAWMQEPREQERPQRRARRPRLPDRRARRVRRLGQLLLDQEPQDVPAAVRRRRPGLSPAGLGVQAVQLRDRHRRRDA